MKPKWASVDAQMGELKWLHQNLEQVIPKLGADLISKHSCQENHSYEQVTKKCKKCKNQVPDRHGDTPKKGGTMNPKNGHNDAHFG